MIATSLQRTISLLAFGALLMAALTSHRATAQDVVAAPEARPSPLALAKVTLDDGTYIKIHYSSPRMRGREVFGGLVPFNQVWRFGANEATEMTVTQPIVFGGQEVEPGTYALFAIPGEDEWTIVLNTNLGQWGAFSYDDEGDYARVTVPSEQADASHEAFTISLEKGEGEPGASMIAVWDATRVTVPIEPGR